MAATGGIDTTEKEPEVSGSFFMQVVGLEPTCSCLRQILSLLRLPFRHTCGKPYISIIVVPFQGIYCKNPNI